jgi:aldehyde:ferredoxin oxidoreductase
MTGPTAQNRLLRVDLSTADVTSVRVPEEWRRRYLGGKGLGARYLYEELAPGVDPLGPANVLAFMLGPLSGFLPGEPRYVAVTKSPLTGTFLDSYAGGSFPATLAGALDDHVGLLVEGQADDPVRIVVSDGDATVEQSEHWGEDTATTATAHEGAVACIGPAGERGVAFATVASDGGEHHAGRGGAGAVMGSKRLKAVVARGEPPSGLDRLRRAYEARYADDDVAAWRRAGGTVESVDFADAVGALATEGWQASRFEGVDGIGIEAVRERSEGRERAGSVDRGDFRVETDAGESVPRGGTTMSLGAGLGIDDFDAVAELGERCNRAGVDLISAGSAIAWAIRASDEGLLDRSLSFGDPAEAGELLDEIVARETPLGNALADGVDAATDAFGGESILPTVKAMALPSYDPRGAPSMALAYATSDRGACHRRAMPVEQEVFDDGWRPERAAAVVRESQDRQSVLWSLVLDDFAAGAFDDLGTEWLAAVGVSPAGDLRTIGERIWTLTRLFNVREGFGRAEDALPSSLAGSTAPDPSARAVDPETFRAMLDAYYEQRGWNADGIPTRATVERLGLADALDDATPVAGSGQ